MKIRIIKKTNINGAIVNIGDEAETAFIAPNDVRTLLNCGCAVVVKEEQKIETKEAGNQGNITARSSHNNIVIVSLYVCLWCCVIAITATHNKRNNCKSNRIKNKIINISSSMSFTKQFEVTIR